MTEKQRQLNEDIKFYTLSFGMVMFQIGERFLHEAELAIEKQVEESKNYKKLKKAGMKNEDLDRLKQQAAYKILYQDNLMGLDDILSAIKRLKFAMTKCTDVQCGIQNLDFTAADRSEMTTNLQAEVDFYTTALINIYELRKTEDDAKILSILFESTPEHREFVSRVREKLKMK